MRLTALLLPALCAPLSGCSLLFGNIQPATERSAKYEIYDPSQDLPDWRVLSDIDEGSDDDDDSGRADLAFQSKATGGVLSLSSACRPSLDWDRLLPDGSPEERDELNREQLKRFSRQLLLGIEPSAPASERFISVGSLPALETTLTGTLGGNRTQVRTVVLRNGSCVYDLMYVAQPHFFDTDEPVFRRFVASLKLRR